MKRIRVTVTQDDIDKRWCDHVCPVARAIRRTAYPNAQVGVTVWNPYHGTSGDNDLPLPPAVTRFIRAFDSGHTPKPATFLLPVPE